MTFALIKDFMDTYFADENDYNALQAHGYNKFLKYC